MRSGRIFAAAAAVWVAVTAVADVDTFLNDSVVQLNSPGSVTTAEGTLLYGGGLQMRSKGYILNPFHVMAPSVKSSCGAIDLSMGSFEFLNADQIVKVFQAMLAQAPGVAFQIGLGTLCPKCAATLNELESIMNQMNKMSLDSCKLATEGLGFLGLQANDDIASGSQTGWISSLNDYLGGSMPEWMEKAKRMLLNGGVDPDTDAPAFFLKDVGTDSFLKWAMLRYTNDTYMSSDRVVDVIRYFTGDFRKVAAAAPGKAGTISFIAPMAAIDTRALFATSGDGSPAVNLLQENTKNIMRILIGDTAAQAFVVNEYAQQIPFGYSSQMLPTFQNRLKEIAQDIMNRRQMSMENVAFLGMFEMPIYQIVNRIGSTPVGGALLDSINRDFALMLSYEVLYEYLGRAYVILSHARSSLTGYALNVLPYKCTGAGDGKGNGCAEVIPEAVDRMLTGVKNMQYAAYIMAADATRRVNRKIGENADLIESANRVAEYTMMRSNPDLFKSYVMSKALVTQSN